MFKLYLSKIQTDVTYLWQRPKQGQLHYTDEKWYDHQRVGKDPLERYMKYLAKELKLSNLDYTNHSIRATCITLLDRAQFEARHIIAVTGHRSESTIKKYARGCSNEKKREISDALASKIQPKIPKIAQPEPERSDLLPNFEISNMELFAMDSNDDDILLDFLNKNPALETPQFQTLQADQQVQLVQQNMQQSVTNVQNFQRIQPNLPAIIPKMFFPNSNVTINYNFTSK